MKKWLFPIGIWLIAGAVVALTLFLAYRNDKEGLIMLGSLSAVAWLVLALIMVGIVNMPTKGE